MRPMKYAIPFLCMISGAAHAAPELGEWASGHGASVDAVAGAELSGWYATSSTCLLGGFSGQRASVRKIKLIFSLALSRLVFSGVFFQGRSLRDEQLLKERKT